ncbi:MAG: hypothetical protein E7645_00445 [Ruminococcaceae bacterium]|nr:hypothetical protein [Oscillospiraceae bacterium]
MMKRILAVLLCVATLLTTFVSCAKEDEEYKGQYITAYITDNVYDFDPVKAYKNESLAKIVSLMFDTLFVLDSNGKVKKSLVKDYWTEENESAGEYKMYLRLNNTNWSDGTAVSANDIVFAWKRLLEVDADQEAASLLFDIKNARAAKEGDASIDDVAIYPSETQLLEIQFEGKINYDQFLLNLTSLALAPLRDDIVSKSEDWAKKPGTMVCSGPFKLGRINWKLMGSKSEDPTAVSTDKDGNLIYDEDGILVTGGEFSNQQVTDFILERNVYYYRENNPEVSIFKSVKPYRICVDCSLTDEQLVAAYEAGMLMYVSDIPLSIRNQSNALTDNATVASTSMSTNAIYFNQNAMIADGSETGSALFAIPEVRQALSMAIDRQDLVNTVKYAEVATGYVPTGVFNTNNKKNTFRASAGSTSEYLTTNIDNAKSLLSGAGVTASNYTFTLKYAAYDEVHEAIAKAIAESWKALGFNVEAVARHTIENNDFYKYTKETPKDICDDLYAQDLQTGNFEAILFDNVAYSADAYSVLASFALAFSGKAMDMSNTDNYQLTPHITGYNSTKYNEIMEAVHFLQYYNKFNSPNGVLATTYFNQNESTEANAAAEKAMYDTIKAIYEEYGISTDSKNYLESRAKLLHAAEDILMKDLPVVPVLFNLDATVTADSLKGLSSTYYMPANFKNAEIKKYEDYLASGKAYINENFSSMKFTEAKECQYTDFELFKTANTIYAQFYLDEKEAITLPPKETAAEAK